MEDFEKDTYCVKLLSLLRPILNRHYVRVVCNHNKPLPFGRIDDDFIVYTVIIDNFEHRLYNSHFEFKPVDTAFIILQKYIKYITNEKGLIVNG